MKRIERVYQALLDEWRQTSCKEIEQKHGSTTQEIATKLKLSRANTSTELNRLVRQAKVIKIKDFPIRYLPVEVVRKEFNLKNLNYYEINSFADLPLTHNLAGTQKAKIIDTKLQNPLENMIGYRGILRQAVIQAKAALMYPPHGLHMMLLGPTGVGKTYFANCIYQYAKYQQIFNQDAPFISFNCADYYNNPQLLLSLLFGYAKGAYTGAVKDQSGLVEQADGGILFLDEVH
ncbi:MAG: sigma 54-interacting transcriptional regulator, partial [Lactobacillaceae bacterium]